MFYKLDEYIYLKTDKYTFKEQIILDNNRRVYCLVAVNGDVVDGLLESFDFITQDEADEVISEYLKNRRRLINFEYSNAKPLIEITDWNNQHNNQ